jgi:hypothetical protein
MGALRAAACGRGPAAVGAEARGPGREGPLYPPQPQQQPQPQLESQPQSEPGGTVAPWEGWWEGGAAGG